MSWIVLTDSGDRCGPWIYQQLTTRLSSPGRLATVEELATGLWDYHLNDRGSASVHVHAHAAIDARSTRAAVNRITALPASPSLAMGVDAGYAQAEWHALLLSWLHELGPAALNPPRPPSLSGPLLSHVAWLALAGRAGFDLPRLSLTLNGVSGEAGQPSSTIWVVGETAWSAPDALPAELLDSSVRLARSAGALLLRVVLDADARFIAAEPTPDLRVGGERLADRIAQHFESQLT